jgi:hypothetical protein
VRMKSGLAKVHSCESEQLFKENKIFYTFFPAKNCLFWSKIKKTQMYFSFIFQIITYCLIQKKSCFDYKNLFSDRAFELFVHFVSGFGSAPDFVSFSFRGGYLG